MSGKVPGIFCFRCCLEPLHGRHVLLEEIIVGGHLMTCPRVCLSVLLLALSAVAQAVVQHGVPSGGRLATFTADEGAKNLARKTAEELKGLLDDVGYDAATKELIGDKEYRESSCNANRFEEFTRGGIVREIERLPLTPRQHIALK